MSCCLLEMTKIKKSEMLFFFIFSPLPSSNSVSDADGQMKVAEVAARPLTQELLDHNVSQTFNKHSDARKLKPFHESVTFLVNRTLNVMFYVGLLPPGSGRDKDLCMEREEGQQSGEAGCYGQSPGEAE